MAPPIALTTDFGTHDGYAGIMKGVILGINPDAQVIDLAHDLPPQDVEAAAFVLDSAYLHFPPGTIHLVVVDPGVGGSRRALAAVTPRALLVAPDNGVLTDVLARHRDDEVRLVALDQPAYWRQPVSQTFHGRDVFAPVAAHLSLGVPLDAVGSAIHDPVRLPRTRPRLRGENVMGRIIHVDRFGNLITDLRAEDLPAREVTLLIAERSVPGLLDSYSAVAPGQVLALVGSHGRVEIAVRDGSAAALLGAGRGAEVVARPHRYGPGQDTERSHS